MTGNEFSFDPADSAPNSVGSPDRWNWGWLSRVYVVEPKGEKQKMPLLFYFPLIIWMGMLEAMQDEMRVPATAKPRR
jgi:hypothetical protein